MDCKVTKTRLGRDVEVCSQVFKFHHQFFELLVLLWYPRIVLEMPKYFKELERLCKPTRRDAFALYSIHSTPT